MAMIEMFIIYVGFDLYFYSGVGSLVVVAENSVKIFEVSGYGHHCGIVGGECALRDECGQVTCLAVVGHGFSHS